MHLTLFEFLPLFIGVAGYLIYFKILKSIRIETLFNQYFKTTKQSFYWVQFTRGVAFICMALLPLAFLKTSNLEFWELTYTWTPTDSKYTIILALILIPLGALNAKGKSHLTQYPQVRMTRWNKVEYITNILSWGLYLLSYEFLFRGVLFLGLIPFTGLYIAIGINTVLYALAHLYKGKKETLGSIPLGIILCYITWKTGTIWTAFAIHWIMAGNNFIWSHYYNSKPPNTFKQSN